MLSIGKRLTGGFAACLRHPTASSIVSAVAVVAISSLAVSVFGSWDKVGSGIKIAAMAVWKALTYPVTVPVWLLIIVVAAVGWSLIGFIIRAVRTRTARPVPTTDDYTQDVFFGLVWRWRSRNGAASIRNNPGILS